MTGAHELDEANQSNPPGIVRVDRRVRRHAQYVDAVMRQVYAATSWDNRIAKIEMAVWDAVEVDRAENELLRSALEVIARHFSSDWPERCQSNVLTARAALTPNVADKRHGTVLRDGSA